MRLYICKRIFQIGSIDPDITPFYLFLILSYVDEVFIVYLFHKNLNKNEDLYLISCETIFHCTFKQNML